QSLADNPRLDSWIAFEDGGSVRLATGKVEIGQGILTALAQIAAEELDMAPERLRVVSGETDRSPSEGFTSGRQSISVGGAGGGLVCAEVRTLFVEHVAQRLGCSADEIAVADGRFFRAGRDTGLDYWSLAADVDLARPATGHAPVKNASAYQVVGRSLPRLDLPAKVKGDAFLHDIAPPDVLHARMLRRPCRRARLAALDGAAVRRAAGAPIDIAREGDLVAFTGDDETAVMRASAAAREQAVWEGGTPLPSDIGDPDRLMTEPSRDRVVEKGAAGRVAGNRVIEALY